MTNIETNSKNSYTVKKDDSLSKAYTKALGYANEYKTNTIYPGQTLDLDGYSKKSDDEFLQKYDEYAEKSRKFQHKNAFDPKKDSLIEIIKTGVMNLDSAIKNNDYKNAFLKFAEKEIEKGDTKVKDGKLSYEEFEESTIKEYNETYERIEKEFSKTVFDSFSSIDALAKK